MILYGETPGKKPGLLGGPWPSSAMEFDPANDLIIHRRGRFLGPIHRERVSDSVFGSVLMAANFSGGMLAICRGRTV